MPRAAIVLCAVLLASPVAAQDVTGACTDGSLWWATGDAAGLGPCDTPEDGVFRIVCSDGTPALTVVSPYPIAEAQRGTVDRTVDGTTWRLEGRGTPMARTGDMGLADAPLPSDARAALAGGIAARLDMPTQTRPFHLTGSGAALAALPC
ncbi:hypothetical protein [Jannaschia donghaensis]|uniref:Uncharacterized protein n=1 Tax=Jannaschia donghaensis TaxID=420998 RepID=A0A0M6YCY4_9RHOB|nr:hypothetical protein [Jannaschia donghaensis]CTQ48208.1 hypothetical protein JDO7802_00210 [Jannaschia donghaensis]